MQAPLRKTALSVALLSVGLAMSAMAQNPGSQGTTGGTSGTTPGATSGSTSGASTSGATSRGATSGSTSAGTSGAASARSTRDNNLARGDRKFLEEAAQHGMAEVQLGQLAAQKGQSSEVKQFGQRMVDDHTKANDQLKSIASSKNVQLPTDMDRGHRRDYDRLSKLSGADFDRAFMKAMVSDHKKDVSDFRKQARSAKDSDVKGFASATAPTLEQHLQMAQQTDATVRTANRGGNTARTGASGSSSGMSGSSSGTSGSTSGGTSGPSSSGMSSGSTSGGTSGSTSGSTTGAGK